MIVILIVTEMLLVVTAQLLLRHGATKMGAPTLSLDLFWAVIKSGWILGGLTFHGMSFFLYVYILTKLRLNIYYPIATGGPIVILTILSVLLLKEKITSMQIAGIAIIVVGIAVVFAQRSS